jgi:hypothetical protein
MPAGRRQVIKPLELAGTDIEGIASISSIWGRWHDKWPSKENGGTDAYWLVALCEKTLKGV